MNFSYRRGEAIWISPIKPDFSYKPEHRHEFLVQTRGSHVIFSYKTEFLIQNWTPIWISHTHSLNTDMNFSHRREKPYELLILSRKPTWISRIDGENHVNFSYKAEFLIQNWTPIWISHTQPEHRHEFLAQTGEAYELLILSRKPT